MIKVRIDMRPLLPMNRMNAAQIAKTANRFDSLLTLEWGSIIINLKSMLGLLSQPSFGDGNVSLIADGMDEEEAVEAIEAIFNIS